MNAFITICLGVVALCTMDLCYGKCAKKEKALHYTRSKEYLGRRYYLSKEGYASSDKEAMDKCERIGGYVAEMDDQTESDFIANFLNTIPGLDVVWISGSDAIKEGSWIHQRTAGALKYTNWDPAYNTPRTVPAWDCVWLWKKQGWKWEDGQCTGWNPDNRFLCEVPRHGDEAYHYKKSKKYLDRIYLLSPAGRASGDEDAIRKCGYMGGYLAEMNDKAESDFITSFLNTVPGLDVVWISGSDANKEGSWIHQRSGAPVTWTNWDPAYKTPRTWPGWDCVWIWEDQGWKWEDGQCTGWNTDNRFLCEIPL